MTEPRLPTIREDLRPYAQYRVGGGIPTMGVRLNANEWPEPTPAGRYLSHGALDSVLLNRYPLGPQDLRATIAEQYGVQPDQLVFGNGSNDTLLQLFLVFGGHGRKTLLFMPTYAMHGRLSAIAGSAIVEEQVGLPYHLTRAQAVEAMERTTPEIVVFCTPNNPTGTCIDDDVILAVAERFPETLVLVDEAYGDIPGRTLLPALADHPNIVISKTFSKVHAAAGLRLGILALHPLLAPVMRVIEFPNVSVVTYALATQIARDRAEVRRRIDLLIRERERVFRALQATPGVEPFPSDANFILFHIGGDVVAAQRRFAEEGLLIRDMTPWKCPGCLRVSIGTPEENDRFVAALASVFAATPV